MQTVVETAYYLKRSEKILSEEERGFVIDFLARNPESGDVVQGTGGVRKVRIAIRGKGKSGGARVIYYYHSDELPLFLFDVYAKNEKDNLSKAERNALRQVIEGLKPERTT